MRIADSTVNMMSGRNYTQTGRRSLAGYTSSFAGMFGSYSMSDSSMRMDSYQTGKDNSGMISYNMDDIGYFKGLGKVMSGDLFGIGTKASAFQNDTLSALLKRFASIGMTGGAGPGGYSMNMMTYSETEETAFYANGRACTEDGRTIDFDVNILMSRSYMEYMQVNIPTMTDALCDPLIVNIGSYIADVRDQTFKFDLDADGTEDEISMPGKGSGFLALDKNGNGMIDDGSELFGTKSGDGFSDLREYDSDGNGWIDENDEIFTKLKVWCKGENGEDILMDLKQADIGAIFLGNQATEFSLGGADGLRDGVVRSTGIFLRESGGAGTIQHVDLALKQNGLSTKVDGEAATSDVSTDYARSGQNSAARRREEQRRQEARARKKKADEKAAAEALYKKRLKHKEYMEELRQEQLAERKEYHRRLQEGVI